MHQFHKLWSVRKAQRNCFFEPEKEVSGAYTELIGVRVIRFENVTKIYPGQERAALDSVSLEIVKGEFVFLVGLSGSGKSTFLRLILREERPTSGTIHVAGKDLGTLATHKVPELRRQVGTVFQDFRLLPNKTIAENVAFTLHVLGYSQKEINREIPEVLELVGLEDKADRLPNEISGGEQQRVAIARALATEPKVLLLDEITSALDPVLVADVLEALRALAKGGATMLIATHEMAFAADVADRICYLEGGRIVEEGSPEKIFKAPRDPRTRAFLKRVRSVGASALR